MYPGGQVHYRIDTFERGPPIGIAPKVTDQNLRDFAPQPVGGRLAHCCSYVELCLCTQLRQQRAPYKSCGASNQYFHG
jgi:hypothetical protein